MTPPVAGGLTQSLNLVAPPGFTQHVTGVLTLPRREVPKLQKSTAENTALAEQEIANVKKGSGVRTTGKGGRHRLRRTPRAGRLSCAAREQKFEVAVSLSGFLANDLVDAHRVVVELVLLDPIDDARLSRVMAAVAAIVMIDDHFDGTVNTAAR